MQRFTVLCKRCSTSTRQKRFRSSTSHPAFLFDLDGVLIQGQQALAAGLQALKLVQEKNLPWLIFTNGGGMEESKRAELLTHRLKFKVLPHNLVQAHTPLQAYAAEYKDKNVIIMGGVSETKAGVSATGLKSRSTESLTIGARSTRYGFQNSYSSLNVLRQNQDIWPFYRQLRPPPTGKPVEVDPEYANIPISAVFVFHDSRDWGRDTQMLCDIARSRNGIMSQPKDLLDASEWTEEAQVPVHFSNPDLLWQGAYAQPRLGQGAFQQAAKAVFKSVTGHELFTHTHGKPSESAYTWAKKTLDDASQQPITSYYMIGDNPASDIAGALGMQWKSALVKTGVYKSGTPEHEPTVIKEDALEAVQWVLEQEDLVD